MRLDENLDYIISDECKNCVHFNMFSSGPSCINGIPDLPCKYYRKRNCCLCGYAVYSEEFNIIFCKDKELFVKADDFEELSKKCNVFHL